MTEWALTPCEDCNGVHLDTAKMSPDRWCCVHFPMLPGLSAVAPTRGLPSPPYNRCANINKGHCPLFVERKNQDTE
jgi:hypothetical protein